LLCHLQQHDSFPNKEFETSKWLLETFHAFLTSAWTLEEPIEFAHAKQTELHKLKAVAAEGHAGAAVQAAEKAFKEAEGQAHNASSLLWDQSEALTWFGRQLDEMVLIALNYVTMRDPALKELKLCSLALLRDVLRLRSSKRSIGRARQILDFFFTDHDDHIPYREALLDPVLNHVQGNDKNIQMLSKTVALIRELIDFQLASLHGVESVDELSRLLPVLLPQSGPVSDKFFKTLILSLSDMSGDLNRIPILELLKRFAQVPESVFRLSQHMGQENVHELKQRLRELLDPKQESRLRSHVWALVALLVRQHPQLALQFFKLSMTLYIERDTDTSENFPLDVSLSADLHELKRQIYHHCQVPPDQQKLLNKATLAELHSTRLKPDVKHGFTILLRQRNPGAGDEAQKEEGKPELSDEKHATEEPELAHWNDHLGAHSLAPVLLQRLWQWAVRDNHDYDTAPEMLYHLMTVLVALWTPPVGISTRMSNIPDHLIQHSPYEEPHESLLDWLLTLVKKTNHSDGSAKSRGRPGGMNWHVGIRAQLLQILTLQLKHEAASPIKQQHLTSILAGSDAQQTLSLSHTVSFLSDSVHWTNAPHVAAELSASGHLTPEDDPKTWREYGLDLSLFIRTDPTAPLAGATLLYDEARFFHFVKSCGRVGPTRVDECIQLFRARNFRLATSSAEAAMLASLRQFVQVCCHRCILFDRGHVAHFVSRGLRKSLLWLLPVTFPLSLTDSDSASAVAARLTISSLTMSADVLGIAALLVSQFFTHPDKTTHVAHVDLSVQLLHALFLLACTLCKLVPHDQFNTATNLNVFELYQLTKLHNPAVPPQPSTTHLLPQQIQQLLAMDDMDDVDDDDSTSENDDPVLTGFGSLSKTKRPRLLASARSDTAMIRTSMPTGSSVGNRSRVRQDATAAVAEAALIAMPPSQRAVVLNSAAISFSSACAATSVTAGSTSAGSPVVQMQQRQLQMCVDRALAATLSLLQWWLVPSQVFVVFCRPCLSCVLWGDGADMNRLIRCFID
jgi:hypothetical protein